MWFDSTGFSRHSFYGHAALVAKAMIVWQRAPPQPQIAHTPRRSPPLPDCPSFIRYTGQSFSAVRHALRRPSPQGPQRAPGTPGIEA